MYNEDRYKKRHSGIQCPNCFMINADNQRLHKFKNTKGLLSHIHKTHSLNKESDARIRRLVKLFSKNSPDESFIKFCYKRGYIY